MTPMGEHVGGSMLRTKKLGFIIIIGFILGLLSQYLNQICRFLQNRFLLCPIWCWILSVALGVVAFSCCGLIAYPFWNCAAAIVIQFLYFSICISHVVPENFLAVAFDSGE